MRDLLPDYDRFLAAGTPFGRAVVTSVWGSAPRPEGSSMLAAADGRIAGSVSGGCVESATALEIQAAVERGSPKLVTFGVSDERAWQVGLACGGTIEVFVEPSIKLTGAQIERLHGPIGLDLGGRQPAETALAILAEMTAVRYGGAAKRTVSGGRLADSSTGYR